MTGKEQREKGPRATMQNVQNEEGKKDLEEKLTAIQKSKNPWSCLFHDFRCSPVLPVSTFLLHNDYFPMPWCACARTGNTFCESGVYRVRWNGLGWGMVVVV
jgi:hypothetical protein